MARSKTQSTDRVSASRATTSLARPGGRGPSAPLPHCRSCQNHPVVTLVSDCAQKRPEHHRDVDGKCRQPQCERQWAIPGEWARFVEERECARGQQQNRRHVEVRDPTRKDRIWTFI